MSGRRRLRILHGGRTLWLAQHVLGVTGASRDNDAANQDQGNHRADPQPDAHTVTTYPKPGVCFGAPAQAVKHLGKTWWLNPGEENVRKSWRPVRNPSGRSSMRRPPRWMRTWFGPHWKLPAIASGF